MAYVFMIRISSTRAANRRIDYQRAVGGPVEVGTSETCDGRCVIVYRKRDGSKYMLPPLAWPTAGIVPMETS